MILDHFLGKYAAVTTLEFLDSDEIRDLVFNYMMKLREEKQNGSGGTKSGKKKKNNLVQTTASSFRWGFSMGGGIQISTPFSPEDRCPPFVRIFAELNRGDTHQSRFMRKYLQNTIAKADFVLPDSTEICIKTI